MELGLKQGEVRFVNGRPTIVEMDPRDYDAPKTIVEGRQAIGAGAVIDPGMAMTLLSLSGNDQRAEIVTVMARMQPAANLRNRPLMLVEWGTGGATHLATIDLGPLGARFSVTASYLRVTVLNVTEAGGGPIRCLATASLGSVGGWTHRPTFTQEIANIAAGVNSNNTAVPPFARTLNIYRVPSGANYTVQFLTGTGGVLGESFVPANEDAVDLLLPNGTELFRIVNGPIAISPLQAVFGLAL